ncbi:hypothetical protein GLYMA_18G144050v4 [Glycine max]|nr:hypothetical protein GLYMA_18G144050v4 [Glycine max]KAH1154539.1 hypothetical protein GYH30_049991 [Glycine max]
MVSITVLVLSAVIDRSYSKENGSSRVGGIFLRTFTKQSNDLVCDFIRSMQYTVFSFNQDGKTFSFIKFIEPWCPIG